MRFPLVLASASPRRRDLLGGAGLSFEVLVTPVEEEIPDLESLAPEAVAERSALEKARWAAGRRPGAAVLGADTVVVLEGRILGKPAGSAGAREMLERLSGRTHVVVTGFALLGPGFSRLSHVASRVRFRSLDAGAIERYIATGEPLDKAGAYAIQGSGGGLVDWVKGSYTNIIGIPVPEVLVALRECGVLEDGPPS